MDFLAELGELALEFAQRAGEVDRSSTPPSEHLQQLADLGYFRFVTDASPGRRRRALDLLSSGCGVTAFLATQHEGVCRRLYQAEHSDLQPAQSGEVWIGVCFAHLRRDPSPVVALEKRDHLTYSGHGPWFTGHGVMEKVLVGGATPEGRFLMGLADLKSPEITVSELPPLAVMEATATVALDFNALAVPKSELLVNITPQELAEKDMHSTVYQGGRSLGAARAAARFLPEEAQKSVLHALEDLHLRMDRWDSNPSWESASELRKLCLDLAGNSLGAAFMAVGGKAHLLTHPLHRIAREAWFYSTTQLTRQLKNTVIAGLQAKK